MTKSTQQLADELARKCAELIVRKDHPKRSVLIESCEDDIHSTIPLLELLELARAAKDYHTSLEPNGNMPVWKALTNLQKKVEL